MAIRTIPGLKDVKRLRLTRNPYRMREVIQVGVKVAKESEELDKERKSDLNKRILRGKDPSRTIVRGKT